MAEDVFYHLINSYFTIALLNGLLNKNKTVLKFKCYDANLNGIDIRHHQMSFFRSSNQSFLNNFYIILTISMF